MRDDTSGVQQEGRKDNDAKEIGNASHKRRKSPRRISEETRAKNIARNRAWKVAHPERLRIHRETRKAKRAALLATDSDEARAYRATELARIKAWQKANPDKTRAYRKAWYDANLDKVRELSKKHYRLKPWRAKEWRKHNRERANAHQNEMAKKKYRTNMGFRLRIVVASRILAALRSKKNPKSATTEALLGCSIAFFRDYIASQFTDGMSWENHATTGWHIDHRIPCSAFDLSDPEQQRKCFHYTNLQPMWAKQNVLKSGKHPGPHQPRLL